MKNTGLGIARQALAAGLACGLVFGLADGAVAAARVGTGGAALAGCLAAAVLSYGLLACAALLALGLAAHPWLRRTARAPRFLLAAGLGAGLFAELYWWSRPLLFYGHSSVSAERLAVAAVLAGAALAAGWWLAARYLRLPRAPRRLTLGLALLAWLGGAAFLRFEGAAVRGELNGRNRDLPNLLLVVVDALRADHLGCYGNEVVDTPVLDALAKRGVLFERCLVQAPSTWTSFGSILTGLYPRRHGLVHMRAGARMVPDNLTLPEHLKSGRRLDGRRLEQGDYAAGTFMTGALSHGSGLMDGFDVYSEALLGHDVVTLDSPWSVFRSELLLWIAKSKLQQRVDSSLVVTLARGWLREQSGRRFAALVHLYSTHTPYDPPAEYRDRYVDPAYDGPLDAFYAWHRQAIERGEYEPTAADVQQIRALYAAGVTQADAMIGELLDELERLGVLDETLVVVTSDHGESLGEGGLWEHGHLVQTNLQVPLILAHPGLLPADRRTDALVETVDLFPTVSELFGLELPPGIDGRSLVPLIEGRSEAVREYAYAETPLQLSVQDLRHKLIVPREVVEDPASALAESGDTRFHDLLRDPEERESLSAEASPEAGRLLAALLEWNAALPIPVFDVVPTARDLDQLQLLRDLGY